MSNQQPQPVQTVAEFADLICRWFFNKSQELDHHIAIPENVNITVTDNTTGEDFVLEGAEREAYIQGLKVARTIFDALPFKITPVNEEGQPVSETEQTQQAAE